MYFVNFPHWQHDAINQCSWALRLCFFRHVSVCVRQCDVCNSTLGNLKAGDSLWMYRNMVHCENCFEVTRGERWWRSREFVCVLSFLFAEKRYTRLVLMPHYLPSQKSGTVEFPPGFRWRHELEIKDLNGFNFHLYILGDIDSARLVLLVTYWAFPWEVTRLLRDKWIYVLITCMQLL